MTCGWTTRPRGSPRTWPPGCSRRRTRGRSWWRPPPIGWGGGGLRFAPLGRGVSPFRGREAELRALGECWGRVVKGEGEAVCLVGEPGIGKSRLAYEFRRSLGIPDWVEGAALSHARNAPYFAFRPLLR